MWKLLNVSPPPRKPWVSSLETHSKAFVRSWFPSDFSGLPASLKAAVFGPRHVTLPVVSSAFHSLVLSNASLREDNEPESFLIVVEQGLGASNTLLNKLAPL